MSRQMKVAIGSMLLLLVVVFGTLAGIRYIVASSAAKYSVPPVTISAEPAKTEVWEKTIKSVGSLIAVNGVDITSEVGGLIREIFFASGIDVTREQVLVQLDDSVEQANLRSFLAQLDLATINYNRDKKLLSNRAISKTDFDTVEAKFKDAQAQVERTRALIKQKKIRAPFSGRLGIRRLNVGDFVNTGDQLVTLQALDFLHVDFYVPEHYFPQLYNGQLVRFTVQAFADRVFDAKVSAINSKVDPHTRNIQVRASFNNDAQELVPGMFANVEIIMRNQQQYLTVPQTAISYSLYGDSVFVVTEAKDASGESYQMVERRYVDVSERRGNRIAIDRGIDPGELIVSAGQLKLNNGAQVRVNNSVQL